MWKTNSVEEGVAVNVLGHALAITVLHSYNREQV
jgi:hypothetical protein